LKAGTLGLAALLILGGSAAQENPSGGPRATGLIPLDSAQVEKIVSTWARVTGVGFNRLGFERVNAVRVAKGEEPLDPRLIKPVGGETQSEVAVPLAVARLAPPDREFAGNLPTSVDNSLLPCFPPIRDQGSLNSCASFVPTYTQLSHMVALQRSLDIRDPADNTNKYSPKWIYNMVNGGANAGSEFTEVYALLEKHGAATWAEFPYDGDFRGWCLDGAVWRKALGMRTNKTQYLYDVPGGGLEQLKMLLTNGYVAVFGTYINSWNFREIQDDPATTADDAEVGKRIAYWLNGSEGSHAMTIVGYNDAIWTDINSDGYVDPGEKGALRIANSWGTDWGEAGFTWLAYDALRSNSSVFGAPSAGRGKALQWDLVFILTARDYYSPLMIAEFTARSAKRDQVLFSLGVSDTSTDCPRVYWKPAAFQRQGGPYAFDGSTTAVNGTFVLDFSDLLAAGAGPQRYYLSLYDNTAGNPATLSAFKLIDLTTDPPTELPCPLVPRTVDNEQVYPYVEYAYGGPGHDEPPELGYPQVSPASGRPGEMYTFSAYYRDPDGDVPSVANVVIDGNPQPMTFFSGDPYSGDYRFATALPAGPHSFYCYFEDGRGGSARAPVAGVVSQPDVYSHVISYLTPGGVLTGSPSFVLGVGGSDFPSGAVVTWDGSDRPTTFVSSSRLDAQIDAADLLRGRDVKISVRDPAGGYGNVYWFEVANPFPSLDLLSPSSVSGGGQGLELTLRGSRFLPNSRVEWNGLPRTTIYISDTELRASLGPTDLATAGKYQVTVTNPPPNGGTCRALTFSVSDFIVQAATGTLSGVAGTTFTTTIQAHVSTGSSYDLPVSFRCILLPPKCTASFSPPDVIPGHFGATTNLTIFTTRQASSLGAAGLGRGGLPPETAGMMLALILFAALPFTGRSPRSARGRPALLRLGTAVLILLMVGLASCGGGGGDSHGTGTPVGTYRLEVQGISGSMVASTSLTLTIY
jgi:hypothetical protein